MHTLKHQHFLQYTAKKFEFDAVCVRFHFYLMCSHILYVAILCLFILTLSAVVPGYFQALKKVLETRVPPPDASDSAHSALADSILAYLTRPLLRPGGERQVL